MMMNSLVVARRPAFTVGLYGQLGLLIGIVMPIVAAICYPTYIHQVQPAWVEWTRLFELPFVFCEILVTVVASGRGYRDRVMWNDLPRDIRWALVLLAIGMAVSSVFVSQNPAGSVALSLITIVHLRFAAAVFFLARREAVTDAMGFIRLSSLGLIALAVLTAAKFAFPPPASAVWGGKIEWASALPGFISVRHFGSWTGAIAAGLMIALLDGKADRAKWLAPLYFLAVGMTMWSGTRAAVLTLAVVAVVTAITLRRLPTMRAVGQVGGLTMAALALALLLVPPGEVDFLLWVPADMTGPDAVTGGRLALWHDTFLRWLDAPVFGWGSGSTFWEVNVGWAHIQPHNVVLQFLISWGIVGGAGGLWLLGRAIVAVHRKGMADDGLRPLAAILHALLFMSLLEGMLFYPRFIMMIMIGFAVILAERRTSGDNSS